LKKEIGEMKIITRGKGIPAYTIKKGDMRLDFEPNKNDKIWLKMNVSANEQYIAELNEFEIPIVIDLVLRDEKVKEAALRRPYVRNFLRSFARELVSSLKNPYPEDIWLPIDQDTYHRIHKTLQKEFNMPIDRLMGHIGRRLWEGFRNQILRKIDEEENE